MELLVGMEASLSSLVETMTVQTDERIVLDGVGDEGN